MTEIMDVSRRKVLTLGSGLGTSALAGCSTVSLFGPKLSLSVENGDDQEHTLSINIFRTDKTERSEAHVYHQLFRLPSFKQGNDANKITKSKILKNRKYYLRAELFHPQDVQQSFRYFPDCVEAKDVESGIAVQIDSGEKIGDGRVPPSIEITQSTCSDSAWWY